MTVDPPTTARFVETTVAGRAATAAVAEVLPALRADLGLGAVTVKWFKPETPERKAFRESTGSTAWHSFEGEDGLQGKCHGSEPDVVWIRSDLDALDAAEVLGHELKHAKHFNNYISGAAEMPDDGEAEALSYGHRVRAALLAD